MLLMENIWKIAWFKWMECIKCSAPLFEKWSKLVFFLSLSPFCFFLVYDWIIFASLWFIFTFHNILKMCFSTKVFLIIILVCIRNLLMFLIYVCMCFDFPLQPNPLNVRTYRIIRDHKTELETSMIGIQFVITSQHFLHGKLKVSISTRSNAKTFFGCSRVWNFKLNEISIEIV